MRSLLTALLIEKYSENQPRDERGRFGSGSGEGSKGPKGSKGTSKQTDRKIRTMYDNGANVSDIADKLGISYKDASDSLRRTAGPRAGAR